MQTHRSVSSIALVHSRTRTSGEQAKLFARRTPCSAYRQRADDVSPEATTNPFCDARARRRCAYATGRLAMRLDPADVEQIAQRVADLIASQASSDARYVTAAKLATILDVDRDWVYANARLLGAFRLGGPNGRLRFDLERVRASATEVGLERGRTRRRRSTRDVGSKKEVNLIPYDA